jgi:NADH-quinone oxidoreductase subunit N
MCMNQYLASLPETYLVIAISILLVFGALGLTANSSVGGKTNHKGRVVSSKSAVKGDTETEGGAYGGVSSSVFAYLIDGNANLSRMCWLGVFVCCITAGLSIGGYDVEYTGRFIIDSYSMTIKTVVLCSSAIILLLSTNSVLATKKGRRNLGQIIKNQPVSQPELYGSTKPASLALATTGSQTPNGIPSVDDVNNSVGFASDSIHQTSASVAGLSSTSHRVVETTASEKVYAYEMVILMLLAVTGLLLLVSSYDLLALYLAIELQSLSLYVLATLKRTSEYSTEAGLKYFILGAISSGLLLFGSSLIYGLTGSINFADIASSLAASTSVGLGVPLTAPVSDSTVLLAIGVVFILSGLLFKLSVAPFHQWTPDVYEGSPTNVTAFFAIVPKIAILGVSLRIILTVLPYSNTSDLTSVTEVAHSLGVQPLLIGCSILSMLVGAFGGLYQTKIKRLLAYSAIGHMGYLTIGLITGSVEGVTAVFIYLFIYMITSIGFFTILLSVESALPQSFNRDRRIRLTYITDLALLSKAHPLLAFSAAIILFSMAGIPPLAGFFSKLYLFLAAISSSFYLLATIAVLTSVVGCFYYIRLIKYLYFSSGVSQPLAGNDGATYGYTASSLHARPHHVTLSLTHSLIISASVFFLVLFILYPGPLLTLSLSLALHLLVV